MNRNRALHCIFLLGLVSLLADMTYEGLRSITGQYLAILGASGTIVGIVAGLGECCGHIFRIVYKYTLEKKKTSRFFTFLGYTLNCLSAPLLAFTASWPGAALLFTVQRFGMAVRRPPRDAMLSPATEIMGPGLGFGIHEALNRIGAVLGPIIITAILLTKGSYTQAFYLLTIPAALAVFVLIVAQKFIPHKKPKKEILPEAKTFSQRYWLGVIAISLVAAGTVHFSLISYHVQKTSLFNPSFVPLIFAAGMIIDGIGALLLGRWYDTRGMIAPIIALSLACFSPILLFLGGTIVLCLGIFFWALGITILQSLGRALVSDLAPSHRRGRAFGIFHVSFGAFWFLGSAFMGFLYDTSIPLMVTFSVLTQSMAVLVLVSITYNRTLQ